jgi:hypothetical protein
MDKKAQIDCFKRAINKSVNFTVTCAALVLVCIGAGVYGGFFMDGHPVVALIAVTAFLGLLGLAAFVYSLILRKLWYQIYRKTQALLTPEELSAIEHPSHLKSELNKKARRLQREGEQRNDLTAYTDFVASVRESGLPAEATELVLKG